MDLVIGLLWFSTFSVIVLFLGALNYFLGRSNSDIKQSQSDSTNQQQSNRTSNNRKKHARNANKKRQQAAAAAAAALKDTSNNDDKQEIKPISTDIKNEEEESPVQLTTDEEKEEFQDTMTIDEVLIPSIQEEEEKPILPVKQRNKNKSNHNNSNITNQTIVTSLNSSKEESILPAKPQASVAPVIQSLPIDSTINIESNQIPQDKHSKSNGKSSYNQYPYSEYNSLPPRFRQRQQKEAADVQKFRKRKSKEPSIFLGSPAGQNDFIPSISKQQSELLTHQSSNQNGYSSESDILTGKILFYKNKKKPFFFFK